jgi:hypothetical protein
MDHLNVDESFQAEAREAMVEHGISLEEALLLVAIRRDQVYGTGDIVFLQPLSSDERRALGLDQDLEEVLARDRAKASHADAARSCDDNADVEKPVASGGVRQA